MTPTARRNRLKPKLLETGAPPYFAVVFSFRLRDVDLSEDYRRSGLLMDRAMRLPGFYGEEAIRLEDRNGLIVSYWRSLEDLKEWQDDTEHKATGRLGIANWYQQYDLRVVEIKRSYGHDRAPQEVAAASANHNDGPIAVIFSSLRTEGDDESYGQAAEEMAELASVQEGFVDLVSLRREDRFGITVSIWRDIATATTWRANPRHLAIQKKGRDRWYEDYWVRVGRVLRQKNFHGDVNLV